jgi:hypothetical protein
MLKHLVIYLFSSIWRRHLKIVQPDTVIRWHRAGWRLYWRWKSKPGHGRPEISPEIQALIRRISLDNPLWGAPRIHGELLKLGYDICQTSIAKYMVRRSGPPAQSWRTFIENHFADIGMAFMGPGLRARSLPLVLSRSSRPLAPHCAYQVIRPNLI